MDCTHPSASNEITWQLVFLVPTFSRSKVWFFLTSFVVCLFVLDLTGSEKKEVEKKINVDREERGEREHHMRQKKGVRGKGGETCA